MKQLGSVACFGQTHDVPTITPFSQHSSSWVPRDLTGSETACTLTRPLRMEPFFQPVKLLIAADSCIKSKKTTEI